MSNFYPNEIITCDNGDIPWMNPCINNLIIAKDKFYKRVLLTSNKM